MRRLLQRFEGMREAECEHVRGLMSDYVEDELNTAGKARVELHLGICPRCRRVASNLRATLERVRSLRAREPVETDDAAERISSSWRDRA